MTASEFAFLALGLVFGAASGAFLVIVLRRRQPAHEVRLTVAPDAIPRRGATLSADAFSISPGEPARGGPADRRRLDRDEGMDRVPVPVMAGPSWTGPVDSILRTSVQSPMVSSVSVGMSIAPERDPHVDAIRIQAAIAAERLYRAEFPTATAVLEARAAAPAPTATIDSGFASDAPMPAIADEPDDLPADPIDPTPALTRILRGDHYALFATVATLAGAGPAERRPWHAAVLSMSEAIVHRTISAGWLDFPVGDPFWDSFTIDQCRAIAGALAVSGHRFDGLDGWEDGRVPNYRDLTLAVAGAGLEPRRIRAWPTQEEIGDLYLHVTAAPDEYLAANAPGLEREEIEALIGMNGPERDRLWSNWDRVVTVLMEPALGA